MGFGFKADTSCQDGKCLLHPVPLVGQEVSAESETKLN